MPKRIIEFGDQISQLYPSFKPKTPGSIVKNITLCVTNDCQLRCTYCYEHHKSNQYMDFNTGKKFIDLILTGDKGMDQYVSTEDSKGVILEFIGGEPMLAVDLIDKLLDYFIEKALELNHPWAYCWRVSISSNGVNYFEPKVQQFLKKWDQVLAYSISLDGNKELHDACRHYAGTTIGCYDEAHAAALDWMSKGHYLGSKMTYSPDNIPYMYDAMVAMLDDGYTEIASNPAFEPKYTINDAKLYYQQGKKIADEILRRNLDMDNEYSITLFDDGLFGPIAEDDIQNWCGGTGLMIACDYDGLIYPCLRYMSMSLGDDQPPLILGNVDDGILQTKKERDTLKCLQCITRRTQSTDECFYCPIGRGCAWCSAWNYQLYGTADKRCTNICVLHKARALFNYYFWNKYYRKTHQNKRMKIFIPEEWALEIISKDEWNELLELERVDR